jgi:hypothetical protein
MVVMPILLANSLMQQFGMMLLLALPIACVSWTVTHEEVFREPREFCKEKSQRAKAFSERKFFYLFTCEYCFSHYVTALALLVFRFQLLYAGWRGYVAAWFALVWIANIYMSLFNRLRLEIKHENVTIAAEQEADPAVVVVAEKMAREAVGVRGFETIGKTLPEGGAISKEVR